MKKNLIRITLLIALFYMDSNSASAQQTDDRTMKMEPQMSEFWTPALKVVTPGHANPNDMVLPPSDAITLFNGHDLSQWTKRDGSPAEWNVENGAAIVKGGTGDIQTKQTFNDFQLHIEWTAPTEIKGDGQGRGNSGIFLQGIYEVQVLDGYQNETYVNGQVGSIYKQTAPLVNAVRKPGEWNVYDIIYTAPVFKEDGSYRSYPRVTIILNGVVIQNNTTIIGTTEYIGFPKAVAHGAGPILLQDHGNPVKYRNIWVREL